MLKQISKTIAMMLGDRSTESRCWLEGLRLPKQLFPQMLRVPDSRDVSARARQLQEIQSPSRAPFGHMPYLSLSTTWRGLQSVPKHSAQQGHSLSISCYKRMSFAFTKFSFSSVFLLVSFSSWGKPLDVNALREKSATVERLNLGRKGRLGFDV